MSQQHIGYLTKLISDRVKVHMDSVFVCHGLTITQSRVLGFLAHHQNRATQKEIEDFLNVSHPTVVGIINRLEQSGFVERLSDPGDRRSRIVSATEQAQSLSHEIELQIDENERQMVRGLTEQETVELKRMHSSDGVIVEGIDNCPIKFAKCCSPLPGDEIIGFVTRGFGVSIHKRDCANARESMRHPENADRWVRAYWDEAEKENYKATLDIVCMDRANLVSDVALALGDMRVPIYSLTARAAEQGRARMGVTVGITNTEHLNSVVARLKKIKDVVSVTRN